MSSSLHGKKLRKALGVRNWESAQKIVRDWEARVGGDSVNVALTFERFIANCEARHLRAETTAKYRLLEREMRHKFASRPVDGISLHDLSEYRESWNLAPISSSKKIERLRTFFRFCMERGWTEKNPATGLRAPKASFMPTLPFTDEELRKVMAAVEVYPDRPSGRRMQLRAFIFVLRYTRVCG